MSSPSLATVCTPVAVYERCGCDPGDTRYATEHFIIDGVGWTCHRGLVHLVCSSCCSGADNAAVCDDTHRHGTGRPWCPDQVPQP